MLLTLIDTLPKDAKLIFVGDLIDRGSQSCETVKYIRENNHLVIQGNHEHFMVEYGDKVIDTLLTDKELGQENIWIFDGKVETLFSYGLIEKKKKSYLIVKDEKKIEILRNDIEWMKKLPLYIKMENPHNPTLPIVISHASIGDFWDLKENEFEDFEFHIMTNRKRPSENSPIFNIYGHANVQRVMIGKNYVSLDTGCGRSDGSGKLSAYCVETQEIFEVK